MIVLLSTVRVPKSLIILAAVSNAAAELGIPLTTVTSGNDSTHMPTSRHYTNEALDFRTHDLAPGMAEKLKLVALQHLGGLYQAILEDMGKSNAHLHIEYQGPAYAPRK